MLPFRTCHARGIFVKAISLAVILVLVGSAFSDGPGWLIDLYHSDAKRPDTWVSWQGWMLLCQFVIAVVLSAGAYLAISIIVVALLFCPLWVPILLLGLGRWVSSKIEDWVSSGA